MHTFFGGESLVPLSLDVVSELGSDAMRDSFRLSGFDIAESNGAWTIGPHPTIEIRLPPVGPLKERHILLTYRPIAPEIKAFVSSDGEQWLELPTKETPEGSVQARIPLKLSPKEIQIGGMCKLAFAISNPSTPKSLGIGDDERLLGLKISSLRLLDGVAPHTQAFVGVEQLDGFGRARPSRDSLKPIHRKYGEPKLGVVRRIWRSSLLQRFHPYVRTLRNLAHDVRSTPLLIVNAQHAFTSQISSVVSVLQGIDDRNEARFKILQFTFEEAKTGVERLAGDIKSIKAQGHEQFLTSQRLLGAFQEIRGSILDMNKNVDAIELLKRGQENLQTSSNAGFEALKFDATTLHESMEGRFKSAQASIENLNAAMQFANAESLSNANRLHNFFTDASNSSAEGIQRLASEFSDLDVVMKEIAASNIYLKQGVDELVLSTRFSEGASETVQDAAGIPLARRMLPMKNAWLIRANFGYIFVPHSEPWVGATLMEEGDIEAGTRRVIERLLAPGDTFIDAGTNVGIHMLAGARAVGSNGHVFAFEPTAALQEPLEMTISLNNLGGQVVLTQAALGDREGEVSLHHGRFSGHNSVYPLDEGGNISESVDMITLDGFLGTVADARLMKIDVEGAELDVLAGGKQFLARNRDMSIIVEFGPLHLERSGRGESEWFDAFGGSGYRKCLIIKDDGTCSPLHDRSQLAGLESVNLLFAPPKVAKLISMEGITHA